MLRMVASENSAGSLRLARLDSKRLAWAFGLSIALHLLFWGGYSLNQRYHFMEKLHLPVWVQKLMQMAKLEKKEEKPLFVEKEVPLIYVDVTPEQAVAEPPKDAKYYSSQNSKAANIEAEKELNIPKITGKQEDIPKTEDVERTKFSELKPTPAPEPEPEQHEKSKPKMEMGDLALAKPEQNPSTDGGAAEKKRPRRLSELPPEKQPRPPGQKMRQDGGVKPNLSLTSLDAKATPFGDYDREFIDAVRNYWYNLLDSRNYAGGSAGKVVVRFRLNYKGEISNLKIGENTVGDMLGYLCQSSVISPAPYRPWSREMRLVLGDSRDIQFTFYYY